MFESLELYGLEDDKVLINMSHVVLVSNHKDYDASVLTLAFEGNNTIVVKGNVDLIAKKLNI